MTPETEQEPVEFPTEYVKDMAIREAVEGIYRLFDVLDRESAHWLSTVTIINADRAKRAQP